MKRTIEVALVALALVGAPLATVAPAAARDEVKISVNPDTIAYGYSDGYWDRHHHWHRWRNRQEAEWYRTHYKEHYDGRRHDQVEGKGWHSADRWWDRH